MKSFDPDFSLRARFQVKYRDVIDVRASKLTPYLSLHDPYYIEIADSVRWSSAYAALQDEEDLVDAPDLRCSEMVLTDSSESSTISSQAASEACSTEEPLAEPPCPGKRRRASIEDPVTKRCKSIPSRKVAHPKLHAGQREHPATPQWSKSVIVRLQPHPNQVVQELLYTFVKLPALDVERCIAAICVKVDIPFTKGMLTSWIDSETSLQGPFDHAFLQSIPDMQDFVIHVKTVGVDGQVGLLFEM